VKAAGGAGRVGMGQMGAAGRAELAVLNLDAAVLAGSAHGANGRLTGLGAQFARLLDHLNIVKLGCKRPRNRASRDLAQPFG